jgi:UDP-N-acetylmuramoylalanine-D-glutamate ligase
LESVDFSDPPDIVIYELSSYMLEDLATSESRFIMDYGILTSLAEAHEDGHGSPEAYIAAKCQIFDHSEKVYISDQ